MTSPVPKGRQYSMFVLAQQGATFADIAVRYEVPILDVLAALDTWADLRPRVRACLRALAAGQETDTA